MAENKNKDNKKPKKSKKAIESIEKAIIRNIPIDEVRWILQPLSITMMRANLSPNQINIIVEMIDRFQDKIKEQIKKTKEEKLKNPSLFTEEELRQGVSTCRIPLSDFDIRPDAYDEFQNAALALMKMPMQIPVVKKDGTTSLAIFNIFSRIEIPMLKKVYNYKNKQRRAGYVELTIDSKNLEDILRIGNQYTKYIKSVTRNRKCTHTPRIYTFISTYKVFGKWTIPFMEFHSMLGFSWQDEKTKEFELLNYKQFSDMKRSVLDPAMKELKKMAKEGRVDCYFDYEPIFPRGKTRGFPEKLVFSIYSSEFGKKLIEENKNVSENIEIENFLKKELKQTTTNCYKLMKLLTEENRGGFQQKMKSLKTYCEDPAHKVENIRSYSWQSLNDYLQAHQPEVEEMPKTNDGSESVCDLTGKDAPTNNKDFKDEIVISEEDQQKWDLFKKCLEEKVSKEAYNTWMQPISFVSYKDNRLLVKVPTKFFWEFLEEKYVDVLREAIECSFGAGTQLMYNINS